MMVMMIVVVVVVMIAIVVAGFQVRAKLHLSPDYRFFVGFIDACR
jgi:hypothetical protein